MALSLKPYQAEGIDFLVDHRRGALFDEPGLGKSMQALLSVRYQTDGQILVVATGDAIGVWQDEIERWLDEPGPPGVFAGLKPPESELDASIVLTNYHRVKDVIFARAWKGVIFDEVQALRNRNTTTLFAGLRKAFDQARWGLRSIPLAALSGTPIVKAAGDVWPILHLIDPKAYRGYWSFVHRYAVTWEDEYGWHVEGVTNAPAMWEELSTHCLRRTVEEVQPDLPSLVRQRVPLTLTAKQRRVYEELDRDWIASIDESGAKRLMAPTTLALETRLRQLLVSPRLLGVDDDGAAVKALAEVADNNTYPFVVFTPFPEAFPYIEAGITRHNQRPVFRLRGGVDIRASVADFQRAAEAGRSPILLASLAMAKSWSVSRWTNRCSMLGFDWNGTTMRQAEMRVRREGQESTVFASYLNHPGTVDDRAIEVVAGKWRLADAILDRARQGKTRAFRARI